MSTSTPLCGGAPALAAKAHRVNQDVLVNPATLDLGAVPCNTTPASAPITISNYSTAEPVVFSATVPETAPFTLTVPDGTVPAATGTTPATREIAVGLKPTATPGTYTSDLEVKILSPAAAAATKTIKLTVKVNGVVLNLSKTSVTFDRPIDTSLIVRNDGNVKACIDYVLAGDGRLQVEPEGDELAPGTSDDVEIRWSGAGAAQGEGQLTIRSQLCAGATGTPLPLCVTPPPVPVAHRR
ncbi:MAG: hypothetical protein KIT84_28215 [Labilithrix sp.]|nr:hypothetical protein [Labilithrix sp.]MCW5814944.1 hypothetical protein [Labilithrix sp.]